MKILSIDFGTKRIGLAIWNSSADVVLPYGQAGGPIEVIDLIIKEKIDKIVLGLPLSLDSSENDNTRKIRNFAEQIKEQSGVEVNFVDERFSSQMSDRMGGAESASRDEKSAIILLNTYLETLN
ncbi:MAG: Holliday junction resolvase RuvX [bacterium]